MRVAGHGLIALVLTALSLTGGLAWLLALLFRRRLLAFLVLYAVFWIGAFSVAPSFGRVALPCSGEPLRVQSPLYCLLGRHYVTPDLAAVAQDAAQAVAEAHPGAVTLALDGSFPFFDGFPLLPHLSHDDGEKLDFAFFYTDPDGAYLSGRTRSPIGYWAFEIPGDPVCPPAAVTLRWGMGWLQPLWPKRPLEPDRTATLIAALAADPRVAKVLVEPPLAEALGVTGPKVRFQGCRAARHDDHVHMQL